MVNAYERITQSPWHSKPGFIRIIEFLEQGMKFITLLIFFGTIQTYYRTPIHLFRRIFISFRAFQRGLASVKDYYRLVRNMNTLFPDATPEQLQNDPMCLICRQEDMQNGKILPCGHIFHANCLYGWLTHSHACPTCRRSLRDLDPQNQQPQQNQMPPQNIPNQHPPVQAHAPVVPDIPQEPVNNNISISPKIERNIEETVINQSIPSNFSTTSIESSNVEEIEKIERSLQVMKDQMEFLTQMMTETQQRLSSLKYYVESTPVEPVFEEKKEEPEEEYFVDNNRNIDIDLGKKEEEEDIEEIPSLSDQEALRKRRLLRFSAEN